MPNSIPVQKYSTRRGYTQELSLTVGSQKYFRIMTVPRFMQGRVQVTTDMSGDAPQFTLDFSNPYTVSKAMGNAYWSHNGAGSITEVVYSSTGDGDDIEVWVRFESPTAATCKITLTILNASANNDTLPKQGPEWSDPLASRSAAPPNVIKTIDISAAKGVYLPDLIRQPDPSDPDDNTFYVDRDVSGLNSSRFIGLVQFPNFGNAEAISIRVLLSTGTASNMNSVEFFAGWRKDGSGFPTGTFKLISSVGAGTKQSNLITTGWKDGNLAIYTNWITAEASGKIQYLITILNGDGGMRDNTYLGGAPPSKGVYGEMSH